MKGAIGQQSLFIIVFTNTKVKFSLEQAMKVQGGVEV
jgi:hypothetical protein